MVIDKQFSGVSSISCAMHFFDEPIWRSSLSVRVFRLTTFVTGLGNTSNVELVMPSRSRNKYTLPDRKRKRDRDAERDTHTEREREREREREERRRRRRE